MEDAVASVEDFQFSVETYIENQETTWLLPFQDMDKSGQEMCLQFARGECLRGNLCPFRHTVGEKTVVCKHWLRSLCKKGDDCEFLHLYDTELMPECHFFTNYGECNNDECQFLHVDPESKIKDCPWYARGFCKHGPKCHNRHAKKVLCMNFLGGFCLDGPDCKYAHPRWELPTGTTPEGIMGPPPPRAYSKPFGGGGGYRTPPSGPIICHKCNEPGHIAPQCPHFPRGVVICRRCRQPGHIAPQCPNMGPGGSAPNPAGAAGGHRRALSEVKCFKCNQMGHYANKCPNARVNPAPAPYPPAGNPYAQLAHTMGGGAGAMAGVQTSAPPAGQQF